MMVETAWPHPLQKLARDVKMAVEQGIVDQVGFPTLGRARAQAGETAEAVGGHQRRHGEAVADGKFGAWFQPSSGQAGFGDVAERDGDELAGPLFRRRTPTFGLA